MLLSKNQDAKGFATFFRHYLVHQDGNDIVVLSVSVQMECCTCSSY